MARYPSGKGEVCKTFIREFDSHPRLQFYQQLAVTIPFPNWLTEAFGFYIHGVQIEAAVLPIGWERRAIEVRNRNTRNCTGWCVEAHDLAVSKLVAFRDKDRDFVRTLLVERLIDSRKLDLRLHQLPTNPRVTPKLIAAIEKWVGSALKDIRSRE